MATGWPAPGGRRLAEIADAEIAARFAGFPDPARAGLLRLRALIFEVAQETQGAGRTGVYAIFTHCQTSLISDFRSLFPTDFRYDGNRAVLFQDIEAPDTDKLRLLISSALTYHRRHD